MIRTPAHKQTDPDKKPGQIVYKFDRHPYLKKTLGEYIQEVQKEEQPQSMYALYLCGATDCFLHAIFMEYGCAEEYALSLPHMNPEGFYIKEWKSIKDIDTSDTGWQQ